MPVKVIAGCSASGSTWCARRRLEHARRRAGRWCARRSGRPARRRSRPARRRGGRARRRAPRAAPARRRRRPSATSAQRHAGQQVGGAGAAGVGHGVRPGDPVAGPRERRPEHGADPAGADDAHGQPGGCSMPSTGGQPTPQRVARVPAGRTAAPGGRRGIAVAVMVPWREAWHDALYGPRGFYRGAEGPAGHFTTSTHGPLGAALADALGRLADREGVHHVVDVGCGRGELLTHLAARRPDLRLHRRRRRGPPGRPAGCRGAGCAPPVAARCPPSLTDLDDVLVVAHEWLDVVPCTVAEVVAPGRLAVVLVDPATGRGVDSAAAPTDDELAWCARYWPVGGAARRRAGRGRPDPRRGVGRPRRPGCAPGIAARRRLRPHRAVTARPAARSRPTARGRWWRRCPTGPATSPPTSPSTRSSTTSSPPSGRRCTSSGLRRRHPRPRPGPHRPGRLPRGPRHGLGGGRADRPRGPGRLRLGAAPRAADVTRGGWSVAPWWGCDSGCRVPPSRSPSWPARV